MEGFISLVSFIIMAIIWICIFEWVFLDHQLVIERFDKKDVWYIEGHP